MHFFCPKGFAVGLLFNREWCDGDKRKQVKLDILEIVNKLEKKAINLFNLFKSG